MPRNKRHERIIRLVRENGFMPIDELAHRLEVTPQTIRRDINILSEEKVLRRYHGGAAIGDETGNPDFLSKKNTMKAEKMRIGDALAAHIPDGATLFLSIGTTIEAVTDALVKQRKNLCIITNNIHVAATASSRIDYSVLITSGVVRPLDGGVTGVATMDFIKQFKVDYAVLSASAVEEDGSLFDSDYKEVSVMQAMMENARVRYLAADHSKFGKSALVRMADITEFDAVFTDQALSPMLTGKLTDAGSKYVIAE
ncbi:MAG: DeoR/GlpR family DNA-binding transcription regulator [Neisseria sp.]|uniref:DeoR/GlpR family DNA-binding transcription regulator n=1 Tax=Neisseria sp. TaxID=192066 RepID=UPI0026DAF328|nr:DeoR/GlpR family DNA-binding transcription regulator [Neisseria sp.]MDO4640875.1 DeoR/GlpR family DNA-binding transcription regulator [Neisseria sp.]